MGSTGADLNLLIGPSTTTCTGKSMAWDAERNSVVFVYGLNNMYGIAEYVDP